MRKILLLAVLFVTCLFAGAQTTRETALDLQMGENSCAFSEENQTSVYYKYTAPADSDVLLTITVSGYSTSINVTDTANNYISTMQTRSNNTTDYVVPVKKGVKIYIAASSYSARQVSFSASVEAANLEGGTSCDDALVATDGHKTFVPLNRDAATYSSLPSYVSYTTTEDGVLAIASSSYLNSCTIKVGCDGEESSVSLSYDSSTSGYSGKCQVEGGKTYIITLTAYSPIYLTLTLTHPTEGASCDLPFLATSTSANVLPKAAGTYWYQFLPDKAGYAVVSSEASLTGGSIKAYRTCSDYSALNSVDGSMKLRTSVSEGVNLLLCIEKAEATAEDETFNIAIEEAKQGDSFADPMELVVGDNTTPEYNGEYYYTITIPGTESKMLSIDATNAGILNSQTQVSLYDSDNSYTSIAYGNTSLSKEVTGGKTYIVKWKLQEGNNGFKFNVTLTDIAKGDVVSNPLTAVLGENELPAGLAKYYTYTATKNGWLSIDLIEQDITVSFPRSASYLGYTYDTEKNGTVSRIKAEAGKSYLIVFQNISEATTFTLSEDDYQLGEAKTAPIVITSDTTALANEVLNTWYVYVAPRTGKLTVTSDVKYESASDYSKYTKVSVAINDGSETAINAYSGQEGSETVFQGSFNVAEGDSVFINVVTVSAQADRSLICTISDLQPGEASTKPIRLENGDIDIPEVSRTSPVWYSVVLAPGDSVCVMSATNSYMYATLYDSTDVNTPLEYTRYKYSSDYTETSYYIAYKNETEETKTYLICVESTYNGGCKATVTIIRNSDGISDVTTGKRRANATDAVFDMQGRKVANGKLAKGLYIINGKKVIIK